jgi:hypothetical protein
MFSSTLRNALLAGAGGLALLCAVPASAAPLTYSDTQWQTQDGQDFTFTFGGAALSDGIGTLTISGRGDFGGSGEKYDFSIGAFSGTDITPTITTSHGQNDKSISDTYSIPEDLMADITSGGSISIFLDLRDKVAYDQPDEAYFTISLSYDEYVPPAPTLQITNNTSSSSNNHSSAIPEPSTLALFGLGIAGLGFARRRKLV